MPGGGLTERNVKKVLEGSCAKEYHISGRVTINSSMTFRNASVYMGGALRPPEFSISVVDSSKIQSFITHATS